MSYVHIKNGYGHGRRLTNIDFPLVHGLKVGSRGFYVMVTGEGLVGFPQRNFRVQIESKDDVEFFDRMPTVIDAEAIDTQSDEEAVASTTDSVVLRGHLPAAIPYVRTGALIGASDIREEEPYEIIRARMIERFEVLGQLSVAAARGVLQGLVVYGGAGVGKSFEVVQAMSRVNVYNKLKFQNMMAAEEGEEPADDPVTPAPVGYGGSFAAVDPVTGVEVPQFYTYHVHRGHISASGLYNLLYNNRRKNEIVIFDDSDGVLASEESLSTLKSALDTTGDRTIMWTISGSRADGVPNDFQFEGSAIFITNTNFEMLANSQSKMSPHIAAILDRCLYLDLMLETVQEKLVRIDYVCRDLKMFERELSNGPTAIEITKVDDVSEELLAWVHENSTQFRELSLRKMHHLARLRKSADNWKRIAEMTLLRGRR